MTKSTTLTLITIFLLANSSKAPNEMNNLSYVYQPMMERLVYLAKKQQHGKDIPIAIDLKIALVETRKTQGDRNFQLQRNTAIKIVSEFGISPSGTRVSLVSFSDKPRKHFDFNELLNKECTIRAINDASLTSGLPFSLDQEGLFTSSSSRKNSLKVLLLLIDGGQQHFLGSGSIQRWLSRLPAEDKVEVFLIAVGEDEKIENPLKRLASKPYDMHFLNARNYVELERVINTIEYKGINERCFPGKNFYHDECGRQCACHNGKTTDCYRIRKEFTSMSFEERVRFIETIKRANLDPEYREEFSRITDIHPQQFDKGIHNKKLFLPWHRWYLYEFENLLRKIDCRVTIPYWNWAQAGETFWSRSHERDVWNPGPQGLGGNGDPDEDWCVVDGPFRKGKWFQSEKRGSGCLKRNFKYNEKPRDIKDIKNTLKFGFDAFEYRVRRVYHNEVHCLVRGTMAHYNSSQAPEFWIHHCFLDKVWSEYQMSEEKKKNEYFSEEMEAFPGCRSKWRPEDFLQGKKLPGCVGVIYEETMDEDEKGNAYEAEKYNIDNDGRRYNDNICYH